MESGREGCGGLLSFTRPGVLSWRWPMFAERSGVADVPALWTQHFRGGYCGLPRLLMGGGIQAVRW